MLNWAWTWRTHCRKERAESALREHVAREETAGSEGQRASHVSKFGTEQLQVVCRKDTAEPNLREHIARKVGAGPALWGHVSKFSTEQLHLVFWWQDTAELNSPHEKTLVEEEEKELLLLHSLTSKTPFVTYVAERLPYSFALCSFVPTKLRNLMWLQLSVCVINTRKSVPVFEEGFVSFFEILKSVFVWKWTRYYAAVIVSDFFSALCWIQLYWWAVLRHLVDKEALRICYGRVRTAVRTAAEPVEVHIDMSETWQHHYNGSSVIDPRRKNDLFFFQFTLVFWLYWFGGWLRFCLLTIFLICGRKLG